METGRDDFVIAIRSAFLKKETQQRFSLIGLIFLSIVIIFLGSFNFKIVNYIKISINELVYRSSFIISAPEKFVKSNYLIIKSHFKLYKDNSKNASELERLRSKILSQKIITLENIKYKKLIDDYFVKDNETLAKVLIDKQSPFLRSVILNKGSKNNIKLGMIVLDEGYLVGKIVEVNFLTSRTLLISDINSKIPVSLQPGDIQAIMSGNGEQKGILQYIKNKNLENHNEEIFVLTSGAGGVFKSGIPIGKIKSEAYNSNKVNKTIDFHKDFSQLKYVKIVSYTKEQKPIDSLAKEDLKKMDEEIAKKNQEEESFKILLKQKKIADEIRIKIEEENLLLKKKNIELRNQLSISKNTILQYKAQENKTKFVELNNLYKKKCKKTFFNKLYKEGSEEYIACILNKGKIKKN